DAAEQQTDTRDQPAAQPGVVDESLDLFGPLFLCAKGELLDASMRAQQHVANLLEGFRQRVHTGDFQLQIRQSRIAGRTARAAGRSEIGAEPGKADPGAEL